MAQQQQQKQQQKQKAPPTAVRAAETAPVKWPQWATDLRAEFEAQQDVHGVRLLAELLQHEEGWRPRVRELPDALADEAALPREQPPQAAPRLPPGPQPGSIKVRALADLYDATHTYRAKDAIFDHKGPLDPSMEPVAEEPQLVREQPHDTGTIKWGEAPGSKSKEAAEAAWQHLPPELRPAVKDEATPSTLTVEKVREWAQRRTAELRVLAELRPAIDYPTSTDGELCARWRALANHAWRFVSEAGELHFRELLREAKNSHRSSRDGSASALPYPPELQWAEALRDATNALQPRAQNLDADRLERVNTLVGALRTALDVTSVDSLRPVAIKSLVAEVEKVVALVEQIVAEDVRRDFAGDECSKKIASVLRSEHLPHDAIVDRCVRANYKVSYAQKRIARMLAAGLIERGKRKTPFRLSPKGEALFFPPKAEANSPA